MFYFDNFSAFRCPNCGTVGKSHIIRVSTNSGQNPPQLILSLSKENNEIGWMPLSGINRHEISLGLLYLKIRIHEAPNSFGKAKPDGYGIIAIDFIKEAPYFEMHTAHTHGIDADGLLKVIQYIENTLPEPPFDPSKISSFTINLVKRNGFQITRAENGVISPAYLSDAFIAIRKKLKGEKEEEFVEEPDGFATIKVDFLNSDPYEQCSIHSKGLGLKELIAAVKTVYHGIPSHMK
jgi:hypothetical protein